MEKKDEKIHSVLIKEPLYSDIKEYCELNKLKISTFINELLEKSFMVEKHGDSPFNKWKDKYNTIENIMKFEDEYLGKFEPKPKDAQEVIDEYCDDVLDYEKKNDILESENYEPITTPGFMVDFVFPKNLEVTYPKEENNEPKIAIKPKKRRLK